ncbi:MAG: alpha/beta hydrolase [Acetobacteraceae bacterium]|nr:alpha/beta hydrolase [Acetobacteraceae bacterium]MSP29612.1 alpha/beta hydrolase [Acetobacteraceae bacterium]
MPPTAVLSRRQAGLVLGVLVLGGVVESRLGAAQPRATAPESRYFTASDGTRLHYLYAGPASGRMLVLIPGWTMPAWIFTPQIAELSRQYRVIAFDPRAQGESEVARGGYTHMRRAQDIAELLGQLGPGPMVLVAWSLAVLETLAYVKAHGEGRVDGLILVDNSVGEEPPPPAPLPLSGPKPPHEAAMRAFVHGMFRRPQSPAYLDRLTRATLRVPEPASRALLAYSVPRSYWREAIYGVTKPILYVVRPKFAAQAGNLTRNHPNAESVVLSNDVGHALFVDDPAGFNALVSDFLARKIWR